MAHTKFDQMCANVKLSEKNSTSAGLVVAAALCAFLPLDVSQLAFVLVGAIAYALLQPVKAKPKNKQACFPTADKKVYEAPRGRDPTKPYRKCQEAARSCDVTKQDIKKPTASPISAPTFASNDFNHQVQELLGQLSSSKDNDIIVQRIAQVVKKSLATSFPQVEVQGFATGDLSRGRAFGVAVPGVDIVVNADLALLTQSLSGRAGGDNLDLQKMHKSAIRACTDRLVAAAGFKFRRSAFRSDEPKVTLLAPLISGMDEAVPLDFAVNAKTPIYHANILAQCEELDARARELILLVKRWSKDRGICHASKGHLSPYLWSQLVVYYLQVGTGDGPVLPPLDPMKAKADTAWKSVNGQSVSDLFKGFLQFYTEKYDWSGELVSVRSCQRHSPASSFPIHKVQQANDKILKTAPSIEDPQSSSNNLGTCMNAMSLVRLHEELARAKKLCFSNGASLAELLELWVPSEEDGGEKQEKSLEPQKMSSKGGAKWENSCAPWRKR